MSLRELREKRKQEYLDSLPTDKEFKAMSLSDKMKYTSSRDFDNIVGKAKKRRSFVGNLLLGASACAAVCAGVCGGIKMLDAFRYYNDRVAIKSSETTIQQAAQDMQHYHDSAVFPIHQDHYVSVSSQKREAQMIKQLAENEKASIDKRRPIYEGGLRFCVALAGVLGGLGMAAKVMPVAKNRAAYKAFTMKRARGIRAREHSLL